MNNDLLAVLYSQQQGFCHIEPLENTARLNRQALAEGREPGYHLIGVAADDAAATIMAQEWKKSGNAHNLNSLAAEG